MDPVTRYVILFLWLAWMLYWGVTAAGVKSTEKEESIGARAAHLLPMVIAIVLISPLPLPLGFLGERLIDNSPALRWGCALLVALGLAFSVWARVHLGRNWSGTVTVKQGHELIRTGPYRYVRHPIYTGTLLAVAATCVARADLRAVIGFVILVVAIWFKLRREERWMVETFGPAYATYQGEVAALIPFVL